MPSTPIHRLRFPDEMQYRTTRGVLAVGTLLRARGTLWRVDSYEGPVAYLEAAEEHGQIGGAVIIPTPLGEDPLTLEVMSIA